MVADPKEIREEGRAHRAVAAIVIGIAVLIGAIFVVFLFFFAVSEPERISNPADIIDGTAPSEGIAVPDGGPLTNVPTQAAPDSPARTVFQQEQQENQTAP